MIVAISGMPGSGKSTIAARIARKFGLNHYSSGEFMRRMAQKKGVSMLGLTRAAEKDRGIDDEIDEWLSKLARYEDNFVIDSRLAFHFMPRSIKIFLDVDIKEAAKRIFLQKRRDEQENITLAKTISNIKRRKESEIARYRKLYRINPYNRKHYDLYIDTTNLAIEQVEGLVSDFIRARIAAKRKKAEAARLPEKKAEKKIKKKIKKSKIRKKINKKRIKRKKIISKKRIKKKKIRKKTGKKPKSRKKR